MKRIVPYYYVPAGIFLLLSLAKVTEPTVKNILMTVIGSIVIGLFAGFVFHMATIVMKKVSK